MAILLLPLAWLLLCLLIHCLGARRGAKPGWPVEILWACLAWGVVLAAITEGLSSLRWLTAPAVAAAWALTCLLAVAALAWTKPRLADLRPRLAVTGLLQEMRFPFVGLAGIAYLTFVIAVVAPPNNWDSLVYHLSRVMHWIQNRSVEFYPTHVLWQLIHPPGAEYIFLHLQLLAGGDYFANLVQWFSMAGALLGVALLARELGADARGQSYAAVVCATIPLGIMQAATAKNDCVVSLWLVCLALFTVRLSRRETLPDTLAAGAALGLALLTKATAYIFGLPFLLLYGVPAGLARPRRTASTLVLIGLIALGLNINHYRRNVALFGLPLGPTTLGVDNQYKYTNDILNARVTALNIVKNLSLHAGSPFPAMNRAMENGVASLASALGLEINDPAITYELGRIPFGIHAPNTSEDHAGNPAHLILGLVAFTWCVVRRRPWPAAQASPRLYAAAITLAFVGFAAYVKWQTWGSHHHLPLFILSAPVAGLMIASFRRARLRTTAAILLVALSAPSVLASRYRPLVYWPPFTTNRSILDTDRLSNYFVVDKAIQAPYSSGAALISQSGCTEIGLSVGFAEAAEYLLWVLLSDSPTRLRIEHYDFEWDARNPSKSLAASFTPCAVFNLWYDDGLAAGYAQALGGEVHQFDAVYVVVPK